MSTLYHRIYGFSIFNTLTEVLQEIVSIIQVIPSFFVFNKPLEIPSYIPFFFTVPNANIVCPNAPKYKTRGKLLVVCPKVKHLLHTTVPAQLLSVLVNQYQHNIPTLCNLKS